MARRTGRSLTSCCGPCRQRGTAPKAAALGIIGRDHILERLQLSGGLESFEYRRVVDEDPLSPRITELAFAYDAATMRARRVLCGINSSPALMGASAFRAIGWRWHRSTACSGVSRCAGPSRCLRHAPHRRAPGVRRPWQVGARHHGEHGDEVEQAVVKITDKWRKQHEREIRDNRAAARREEIFAKRAEISQKAAAAEIMVAAYLKASTGGTLPVAARQIMYAARDHIQERSGKPLDEQVFHPDIAH